MTKDKEKEKTIQDFDIGEKYVLVECERWSKPALHIFDREQAIAVLAAMKIRRPLLVRGEPGCGKTQMARAVAQVFKMPLACLVVNERTETADLLYQYDALWRLSDANNPNEDVKDEAKYLSAGPLWWALNWKNASDMKKPGRDSVPYDGKGTDDERSIENGVLLLIDEIDKADRSVPNSLLEVLDTYSFPVPYIGQTVKRDSDQKWPLIIITTNEEQSLPPAFVRRCLVLDLTLPEKKGEFIDVLAERGRARWPKPDTFESKTLFEDIAGQLYDKRELENKRGARYIPGQAEYLDHLEAILMMKSFSPETTEEEAVKELAKITYGKGRNQ